MKTKLNRYTLAFFATVLIGYISLAQGSNPAPPPPAPPPPPGLPINQGLTALFLMALVYGIYRSLKLAKREL